MGFKHNLNKPKESSPKKKNIRPTNRRCAQTIMEQYSERIDLENCRRDLKALLKKCLFKIVAAESVDQEISFLNEVKRLLQKACQGNPNASSYDSLKQLIKEMYQIAVDKQIDQHYHQSSKYIDHLNVHDESFRMYALRNFQALTSSTNGENQLTFANLLQYNQQTFGLDVNSEDIQEDIDDGDDDDDEQEEAYEQLQMQPNLNSLQTQTQQLQYPQQIHSLGNTHNRIVQSNRAQLQSNTNNNIVHLQQSSANNRQLTRSSNRTSFNFFSDNPSTASSTSNHSERQNLQTISFSSEPLQIRYQTNNQNQNQIEGSVVRVNFIDQHIMTGDNDYRISYMRNRNTNNTHNSQIRVEDHKDQQQLNEQSQQNFVSQQNSHHSPNQF